MSFTYEYPRPAVTVDCVLFGVDPCVDGSVSLQVLLIKRKNAPFQGVWALPGGFVHIADGDPDLALGQRLRTKDPTTGEDLFVPLSDKEYEKRKLFQGESLEDAARRELKEETGVDVDYLEQLYTFGKPGRDPRGRVISVAYMALTRSKAHLVKGADDATEARWVSMPDVWGLVPLAFDHQEILVKAVERLRAKVRYAPIGFNLLPPKFTLTELQRLYEAILTRQLDKSNFRKRILAMGILKESGKQVGTAHRAARLYRFDKTAYDRAVLKGFNFEI